METDYFDIEAGLLQGDTLAPYLFIICLHYVIRTSIDLMKENGFMQAKKKSRRYRAQTITDADYADDIARLANTSSLAESLLYSLERVAGGIGLHVNADKTEYKCFNQRGDISTLYSGSLKLVDTASHQSKRTSTRDLQRHGQQSIGHRSYGSQFFRSSFFLSSSRLNTAKWMHCVNVDEAYGGKA